MEEHMMLPTGKPHVSFSEISEWARCSWKHKLKHIDKLGDEGPSPYLVFGTAVHDACEEILKVGAYDANALHTTLAAGWGGNESIQQFAVWPLEVAINDALDILAEVPGFLETTFPGWQFVDAEAALYERIDGHPSVHFKGYVDCVIAAPDKHGRNVLWILDWKTSNRGWFRDKRTDPITLSQVVLYRNYLSQKLELDVSVDEVKCGFVVLNRSAKQGSRCDLVKVSTGPVTVMRALKLVDNAVTSIKRGVAIKNKGEACRWCEFSGTSHCP